MNNPEAKFLTELRALLGVDTGLTPYEDNIGVELQKAKVLLFCFRDRIRTELIRYAVRHDFEK